MINTCLVPRTPRELGPGFEKFPSWRPEQDTTLEKMLSSSSRFILFEGPTGSGKTIVNTALHKLGGFSNTVYCCSSKQLQDQYMGDFHSFAVDIKGRNNYPCQLPGVDSAAFCLDSVDYTCEERDKCEYKIRVEEARKAEVAVLNTWSLLYQIKYAGRFTNITKREDEPHRELLILDEADTLERVLTSFAGKSINKWYCKQNYLGVPDFSSESHSYWIDWLEQKLSLLVLKIDQTTIEEEKNKLRVAHSSLSFLHENLLLSDTWVIEADGYDKVKFTPTDVSGMAERFLFQHFDRVLLSTASFCGVEMYTNYMGISEYEYFKVPSYFPKYKRPVYYFPVGSMGNKHEEGTLSSLVETTDKILETFPSEKAIIHTVSNKRAEKIIMLSTHPIALFNSENENKVTLSAFREGTLQYIISPSLERGYDFPDDMSRLNIIAKVPYSYLGDKSIQKKKELHPGWYEWVTVQRIVQMTGRTTRSSKDYSISFILDTDFRRLWDLKRSLFPDWWQESCRQLLPQGLTPKLMEEASE